MIKEREERVGGLSGPNYIQSWEIGEVQSERELQDESERPDEPRWSDFTEKEDQDSNVHFFFWYLEYFPYLSSL